MHLEAMVPDSLLDAAKEEQAMIVAPEDGITARSAMHHVMPCPRPVESRRACHSPTLASDKQERQRRGTMCEVRGLDPLTMTPSLSPHFFFGAGFGLAAGLFSATRGVATMMVTYTAFFPSTG